MKFILTEMDGGLIRIRLEFNTFAELKDNLIKANYFGWINDNVDDPKDYKKLPDFKDIQTLRDIDMILDDMDYTWWSLNVKVVKNINYWVSGTWYNSHDGSNHWDHADKEFDNYNEAKEYLKQVSKSLEAGEFKVDIEKDVVEILMTLSDDNDVINSYSYKIDN